MALFKSFKGGDSVGEKKGRVKLWTGEIEREKF